MIITSDVNHLFEAGSEGTTLMQLEFLPELFSQFNLHTDLGMKESAPSPVFLFSEENRLIKIVNNVRIMRSVQRIVNELEAKSLYYQYLVMMYYAELLILIDHCHLMVPGRQKANQGEVMNVIGDVKGKDCILFDDMVDTAGSLCNAAKAIVEVGGANKVYACASHGVLSGPAIDRINSSVLDEVIFLDTIPAKPGVKCEKIKYISVAHMFAEAISHIYMETSVSPLFL